ncbi:class I SAM-dependent methyltransferase [Micromonospora sp. NPDC002296]|uniref:class I SAM-dependent methyltransferase n=1 Tax=Micromonospora sp. NPDC002296 TaxID=3154271 RepID=UPI00331EB1F1
MTDQLWAVYDTVADVYDEIGPAFFKPVGSRLVGHAAVAPGERVLDIGTGRGAVLFPAAAAAGPDGEVTGIDLAPRMIQLLQEDIARRGIVNARAVVMDGRAPTFAPGTFDLITASMSLPLVPDHPATLANYARLLRPGGRIALAVPGAGTEGDGSQIALEFFQRAMRDFAATDAAAGTADALDAADEVDAMTRHLRGAGFVEPRVVVEDVPLVAASGEEFVRWTYAQGLRLFWDMIPQERRPGLERQLAAELDTRRDADGCIRLTNPVCFIVATSPDRSQEHRTTM